jgi:peptidyl-prolyl cis-trans isomerase SurA
MRLRIWFVCLALGLPGSRANADLEPHNGIAAIANDTVITMQDVEMASLQSVEVARRTSPTAQIFYQRKIQAMRDALDSLIERQLILADFKTIGVNVPDSYIDDVVNERIRQRFGDRANLQRTLKAENVTFESFRQRMKEEIILDFMRRKYVREVSLISPAKIERYYQTNLHRFKLGDQVKLRIIVLRASEGTADDIFKLFQDILRKLGEGVPFPELAAMYTDELSRRKEGGLWGWKERSALRPDLAETAFGLESNQVSGVIGFARAPDETYWSYQYDGAGRVLVARHFNAGDVFLEEKRSGTNEGEPIKLPCSPQEFYLIKAEDKQVAHTRPLEEVREEIEKDLIVDDRMRLEKQWIQRLRSKFFWRYF